MLAEFQQKDGELRQLLDSMGLTSGLGDGMGFRQGGLMHADASGHIIRASVFAADVGVELPLEVRRARAALHEIGGSEGLLTPLTALSRVADTVWIRNLSVAGCRIPFAILQGMFVCHCLVRVLHLHISLATHTPHLATLQLQPALARVQSMQQVEQERNVALRAADSRYGGDGSVPRLTSETDACAAAYDLVCGGGLEHWLTLLGARSIGL